MGVHVDRDRLIGNQQLFRDHQAYRDGAFHFFHPSPFDHDISKTDLANGRRPSELLTDCRQTSFRALRFLAEGVSKRANLSIQIKTTVVGRLPGPIEIALYRIVQEALTNAAKHSKASRVRIRIGRKNRLFCCSIEDDGMGFDVRAVQSDGKRRGLGLIGMQERLHGIAGTLSIDSARGRGTRLLIQLPADVLHGNPHRGGR